MIKFVFAAIWICLATIGSMYFAFARSAPAPAEQAAEAAPMLGGLDYVKTEVISVPVLAPSGVSGYFLARFVYTIEQEKMKKLSVPADALIVDTVYTYLFSNPAIDFTQTASLDIDALRTGVKDAINARIGEPAIHDVMVEQIDFLTKDEIRDNTIRRKQAAAAAARPKEKPKADAHGEAAGGHGEKKTDGHGEEKPAH